MNHLKAKLAINYYYCNDGVNQLLDVYEFLFKKVKAKIEQASERVLFVRRFLVFPKVILSEMPIDLYSNR